MKPGPIIPQATALNKEGRSAENIIWSRKVSKSISEYIPLVVSEPELTYFHVDH